MAIKYKMAKLGEQASEKRYTALAALTKSMPINQLAKRMSIGKHLSMEKEPMLSWYLTAFLRLQGRMQLNGRQLDTPVEHKKHLAHY